MSMITIEASQLRLPFRLRHKQASSDRVCGDSIWVEARRGAVLGLGEGCPRDYVTGETTAKSLDWLSKRILPLTTELSPPEAVEANLHVLRRFAQQHENEIDQHPAAWCAIELALLDLFAREAGLSVERLLAQPEHPTQFRYTAVLSDIELERSRALLARAVAAGITELKLKLSGDLQRDRARLALVRDSVAGAHVRLDANNLWGDRTDDALRHLSALGSFDAIEEPLRPRHAAGLARLSRELGVPVIVDESLSRAADFALLDQHPAAWIANLKVSKCGGLLRAIAMAEAAQQRGIPVLIGAQVGETSVLTRAGIVLARALRGAVTSMEGAAGLLLLERDAVTPILQMGDRGIVDLDHSHCGSHGLGLSLGQWHELASPDPTAT